MSQEGGHFGCHSPPQGTVEFLCGIMRLDLVWMFGLARVTCNIMCDGGFCEEGFLETLMSTGNSNFVTP